MAKLSGTLGTIIAKVIAIMMLLAAASPLRLYRVGPFHYYDVLRWVVCAVCFYVAWEMLMKRSQANDLVRTVYLIVLLILVLIYDPIFRLKTDKSEWSVYDCLAAAFFIFSLFYPQPAIPGPISGKDD